MEELTGQLAVCKDEVQSLKWSGGNTRGLVRKFLGVWKSLHDERSVLTPAEVQGKLAAASLGDHPPLHHVP